MVRERRPSLTARWVAAQRARLRDARPVVVTGDPDAEERLYRTFSRGFLLPGLRPTGMALRTAYFDDEVVTALERGIRQVVVVGAGYDGRALRFRSPGVRWFEVDHPATQPDKQRRLARLGTAIDHITFVPVDLLADDLVERLAAAGHDPGQPTLFVCEGLFAYLPHHVSWDLCHHLRRRGAPGSVLAASFLVLPRRASTSARTQGVVDMVLAAVGERRLGVFHPGDAERLLTGAGWAVVRSRATTPNRLSGGSYLLLISAE